MSLIVRNEKKNVPATKIHKIKRKIIQIEIIDQSILPIAASGREELRAIVERAGVSQREDLGVVGRQRRHAVVCVQVVHAEIAGAIARGNVLLVRRHGQAAHAKLAQERILASCNVLHLQFGVVVADGETLHQFLRERRLVDLRLQVPELDRLVRRRGHKIAIRQRGQIPNASTYS